ncbi:MAG: DUF364 domain-containing protein [Tissierellales bacterium]
MLIEKVYAAAQNDLEGLYIKDLIVGISFVGVQLSNDNVAFIYLMREKLPSGCSIFSYCEEMIGMKAIDCAKWAITGAEDLQRSLGCAVINAANNYIRTTSSTKNMDTLYEKISSEDTVGVIGHMPPLVKTLASRVKRYISFDRAIEIQGSVEGASVYPVSMQSELLPQCDVVIITGTTMINLTTDEIVKMCTNAREIALIGFSVPFYPLAYKDSGITAISGIEFKNDCKEELFKKISRGCGRLTLHEYGNGHFCRIIEQ